MFEIIQSATFNAWFRSLRDRQASRRIQARIDRLEMGNPGQHRALTGGVCEMKIDYGPGYRVYYTMRKRVLVILLCGGDKGAQNADIARALRIAKDWQE
ncbi:MAG: type II toxin-antitoxin system RelE/ParE family toxin [Nevskiales bacterium]